MPPDCDETSPFADTEVGARRTLEASVADALAGARPDDPAGRLLAQARIASVFFGPASTGLGRFRVLERLGVGGMGIVYAAYDPDLDRGVALKLVHVPGRGRDAALAEAKALARLAHPNIVPVFDVGIEGEHVYIVMELVRGKTLRDWVRGRDRRAILAAYRQAGEALAAAHAAGLVHRDFKPDNAIVGDDGRIRVVDFGLACEASDPGHSIDEPRPVAGTPRYMAPEQAAGTAVSPAADQYSFSVSLAEALTGPHGDGADARPDPLPRWLAAVIERGSAPPPSARFPSMHELLRALARDPATIWRRRIAIATLGVAGVATFVAGRASLVERDDACHGGDARLAAIWAPGDRRAVLDRVATLGTYGRTLAPQLESQLRDHRQRWATGYRDACLARRRGLQSDALVDRRMVCLDRSRAALASVADIVRTADAQGLPEVALAVRALPDPGACSDLAAVQSDVELPPPALSARVAQIRATLEDARVQIAAGRYPRAQELAGGAVEQARATGYRPLVAEALLVQGHAIMSTSPHDRAIPALAEAVTIAFEAGADALAIEAWARRAWLLGNRGEGDAAVAGLDVMEALAARTPSRFARALLYNNLGGIELDRDQPDRARPRLERALAEASGVTGPGVVELVNIRLNLALVTSDPVRRDRTLADAESELTRLLGSEHPRTLNARWLRGMLTVRLHAAASHLSPVCEGFERHESLASRAAACWSEVGHLYRELGEGARAISTMERALRTGSAPPGEAFYLLLWQGHAAAAADRFAEAVGASTPGTRWWEREQQGWLQLGLGSARRASGDLRGARPALQSSIAHLAAVAQSHPSPRMERLLARARAELALTMAAMGGMTKETAELAGAAAASLRDQGAPAADIEVLERLAAPR